MLNSLLLSIYCTLLFIYYCKGSQLLLAHHGLAQPKSGAHTLSFWHLQVGWLFFFFSLSWLCFTVYIHNECSLSAAVSTGKTNTSNHSICQAPSNQVPRCSASPLNSSVLCTLIQPPLLYSAMPHAFCFVHFCVSLLC